MPAPKSSVPTAPECEIAQFSASCKHPDLDFAAETHRAYKTLIVPISNHRASDASPRTISALLFAQILKFQLACTTQTQSLKSSGRVEFRILVPGEPPTSCSNGHIARIMDCLSTARVGVTGSNFL